MGVKRSRRWREAPELARDVGKRGREREGVREPRSCREREREWRRKSRGGC